MDNGAPRRRRRYSDSQENEATQLPVPYQDDPRSAQGTAYGQDDRNHDYRDQRGERYGDGYNDQRRERFDDRYSQPPQYQSLPYQQQPYQQQPPPIHVVVNNTSSSNSDAQADAFAVANAGRGADYGQGYGSESWFDGTLLQLIGWTILGAIITTITFGIGFPWAICRVYGWKINHTIICGRRLYFKGSALGLFGQWIKWFLLSIITCGIYLFWASIKLEQWKVRNTTFEA